MRKKIASDRMKQRENSESLDQIGKLPKCERSGDRLIPSKMFRRKDLALVVFKELRKRKSSNRCIICREQIKEGERVVRQQVGSITRGKFASFETLGYQHTKCRSPI